MRFGIYFVMSIALMGSVVRGEDWPHWMGPNRDNRWEAENIIRQFPAQGPKEVWSTPVAAGYSGPAVVGDRLFLTDFEVVNVREWL